MEGIRDRRCLRTLDKFIGLGTEHGRPLGSPVLFEDDDTLALCRKFISFSPRRHILGARSHIARTIIPKITCMDTSTTVAAWVVGVVLALAVVIGGWLYFADTDVGIPNTGTTTQY